MKDGWHVINGNEVFVESGKIVHGVKESEQGRITTYPYHWEPKYNSWSKQSISPKALYNKNYMMA